MNLEFEIKSLYVCVKDITEQLNFMKTYLKKRSERMIYWNL